MRSRIKVSITFAIMVLLILLSSQMRCSIQNSLSICAEIIIPSLFPFFIISGILVDFGLDTIMPPPICSLLMSLICGCPIGTKTVCHYFQKNMLSQTQAQALLLCTANASPAFVIVALGEIILKSKATGTILFLCQFVNSLIIFLLFVPQKQYTATPYHHKMKMIEALLSNVKRAIEQILFVCGVTIIFGMCCDIFLPLLPPHTAKWIGIIEILHSNSFLNQNDLYFIATMLGFSGFCIWTQCIFFICQTDLKISFLIIGKLQSAIALPQYVNLFISPSYTKKIISLLIIILTNIFLMCIIKNKGCDNKYDFFKKHREMLCFLRARNKNSIQRTGALSAQGNRRRRTFLSKIPVHTAQANSASTSSTNRTI